MADEATIVLPEITDAAVIPPALAATTPAPKPAVDAKPAIARKTQTRRAVPAEPIAAAPAPAHIEEPNMATTFENTTVEAPNAMLGDMNASAKGTMEKGAKMLEELNAFNKGNIEAMVESSKIAAKGFESLGQDAADYARKSYEASTAAMKTLATVKSPTEFLRMQGEFARTAFDTMVAETSRSTEKMMKLAGEVAQPLSNRFAVAAEKAKLAA